MVAAFTDRPLPMLYSAVRPPVLLALLTLGALPPGDALAQPVQPTPPPPPHTAPAGPAADPLDPNARVPAAVHRSAFGTGRAAPEAEPIPWRAANDEVGRIGGWRAYLRESTPAPDAPSLGGPVERTGHEGHRGPRGAPPAGSGR